jgi:hypothetical protein
MPVAALLPRLLASLLLACGAAALGYAAGWFAVPGNWLPVGLGLLAGLGVGIGLGLDATRAGAERLALLGACLAGFGLAMVAGQQGRSPAAGAVQLATAADRAAAAPSADEVPLPEDPAAALAFLGLRHQLRAQGASELEVRQVLEAQLRSEAAAAQAQELADQDRAQARRALADELRSDLQLVRAGQLRALESGPLDDRGRWDRALFQLQALDPERSPPEVLRPLHRRALEELLGSLEARREVVPPQLAAPIAALEVRLELLRAEDDAVP